MLPALAPLRSRYDAILLDLDGTLLDGRSQLTPRTIRAVRALVDAGIEVVVCTGRSAAGTQRVHAALGLDTPHVSYNGAWIGRMGETPWRSAAIPDHLVPHVERTERHARFSFRHHDERKYTLLTDHGDHPKVAAWYEDVVRVTDPEGLPRRGLMRVSLYFQGEVTPDHAWDALPDDARGGLHKETFPLHIFPDFPGSDLLLCEVQAKGRGKAEAFEWLRRERGIPPERTIAVGDQMNDVPMFEGAGLAVAVGNAVGPVLDLADVVIGHHAEEGFARWVEAGAPVPEEPARRATGS